MRDVESSINSENLIDARELFSRHVRSFFERRWESIRAAIVTRSTKIGFIGTPLQCMTKLVKRAAILGGPVRFKNTFFFSTLSSSFLRFSNTLILVVCSYYGTLVGVAAAGCCWCCCCCSDILFSPFPLFLFLPLTAHLESTLDTQAETSMYPMMWTPLP